MKIEKLNKKILKCKKCKLYKTRNSPVVGEGPVDSKYMLIAQAPGRMENIEEKMFVGPSGKFLQEIFEGIDLDLKDIYKTNLLKCWIPKSKRPNLKIIESCFPYLKKEIKEVNPDYIFVLGFYPTRRVFDYFDIQIGNRQEYKDNFAKLFWKRETKLMPLPHPAAAIYNGDLKEGMKKFYKKINIVTQNCKWYELCPMRRYYEQGKLNRKWIELYCRGDWSICKRFEMEEKGKYHPDNMLPDGSIAKNF
jgi:DNA polymerase